MSISKNEIYKFFAEYIYKNTGIFYPETDYYRLEPRLKIMMNHYGANTEKEIFEMYAQKITPEMHTFLINVGTNNETFFFRDSKPYAALTQGVIPDLEAKGEIRSALNIWSNGCSNGQEIYSILMSIKENCPAEIFNKTRITATDIDTSVLQRAQRGEYDGLEIQRGLPITLLMKYFTQNSDEKWDVNSDLKSKVTFQEFNLLSGIFPIQKYDIIFCRNVLIYQQRENKQKILEGLYGALKPGGYFLMGAGESMIWMNVGFKQVKIIDSMYFVKDTFKELKAA